MSFLPPSDGSSHPPKNVDRRAHQRRPVSPRLYVVLYGANSDGILYDVSEGGAALNILGAQPEGEYVVVDFEMAEIGRQFEANARISWRDEAGKKVGVHFVDLPEDSRAQLKDWLLKKMSLEEAAQPALIQDAARELGATSSGGRAAMVAPGEPAPGGDRYEADDTDDRGGEKLVQNLINSFNKRPADRSSSPSSTPFANVFSSKHGGSLPEWISRQWIALTATAVLAMIVVLGIDVYRSPARNVGINVSKVGELPMARANKTPFNAAAGASIPQSAASRDAAEDDANSGSTIANDLAPPGVPPPFQSLASGKLSGQPPCTNLGLAGDKIRIYLWSEKDTPPAITAAYANHLQAVVDVRIVSKAPYDLVVYVNGAIAGALDSRPGFIWSSRVFRPWYCGQTLGFLEQTQVNESLHYVESSNLDRHIQSEVAYMILHSFEAVRNEHVK